MHLRKDLKRFKLKSRRRPKFVASVSRKSGQVVSQQSMRWAFRMDRKIFWGMLRHEEKLCLFVIAFWGYVSTQCMYSWHDWHEPTLTLPSFALPLRGSRLACIAGKQRAALWVSWHKCSTRSRAPFIEGIRTSPPARGLCKTGWATWAF